MPFDGRLLISFKAFVLMTQYKRLPEVVGLQKLNEKQITYDTFEHNDRNKDGAKLLLSFITATLTISCVLCVFFWQKHEENSIFYNFCTRPCKRISISPAVTIIARCDKCANTGCITRDCLCVYAYARMALAIIPTSHAEVIIRSHCYVIKTAQFFAPNW